MPSPKNQIEGIHVYNLFSSKSSKEKTTNLLIEWWFKSSLTALFINNVKIINSNKNLTIRISEKSDIVSLYIILKYFSFKKEIKSIFIIDHDEKGVITYTKDNHQKLQYLTLNEFLYYYTSQLIVISNYDDNSDKKKIIGWSFLLDKEITFLESDIETIYNKISGYKGFKLQEKKINNEESR